MALFACNEDCQKSNTLVHSFLGLTTIELLPIGLLWLQQYLSLIRLVSIMCFNHKAMALELKHVVETNLIRVSYHCISHSFHFNSYLKVIKWSTSVIKVGVAWHLSRHSKEELAWAIDKWSWIISNICLLLILSTASI